MAGEGFGQPQWPGWMEFNVGNMRVLEIPTVPGDVANIIDVGEAFTLELDFEFKGPGTFAVKVPGNRARIVYRAESIGGGAEFNLGTACVDLDPAVDSYTAVLAHGGLGQERIYRIGAVVTLENVAAGQETNCAAQATRLTGYLGFYEGLLMQVNPSEAP